MRFSQDEFAELVEEALKDIPRALAEYLRDVTVDIEPMPDPATCESVGLDDPRWLLGLYLG